jgi:FMN phosphatase YigB (HAD superfamily)
MKACEYFKCLPSDCFFVGDSWENDILGSKNAGMKSIWLNHYNVELPKDTSGVYIVNELIAIKGIVEQR